MADECDVERLVPGRTGAAERRNYGRAENFVLVCEANSTIGGGARSAELTLPGFLHDAGVRRSIPSAAGSPFFKALPLERFGLEWIQPDIPLAHPLDDGSVAPACIEMSILQPTEVPSGDSQRYRWLMNPLARLEEWRASQTDVFAATSGPSRSVRNVPGQKIISS